jgi:serine/threonine-protein kinase
MAASPSPSPEAEISIGTVLDGRYRIESILGTGGMGCVYRAEHTGIGRPVAIKVLHADLNRNREAAQRFQREAIASGRLDHPNIVNVSDFGVLDAGPCYLVMEVLEGESLGARLEREQRIPWREALEIMRGVLLGLHHAHERGVVHRDIKPDNVFLTRKGSELVVKILDFGIAKLFAGTADDPASTRAGLTVGTPAYLSPEQAVGGEIKPASDLYSATILLFEMLTGRAPFEDKDPLAMLGAHVSREPPRVAEVAPDVAIPAALEDVIQRGLIKTSADRISAADDYIAQLDAVIASARLGTAPIPVPEALGSAPTAMLATTPPPGTLSHLTPVPGHDSTMLLLVDRKGGATALPANTRAISLAEAPPIPRNWIKIGAIVLGLLAVITLIAAIASGGGSKPKPSPLDEPSAPAPKKSAPAKPKAAAPPREAPSIASPPTLATVDRDTQLKALLHDLESLPTCPERKAVIAKLVELGDDRAVKALKTARFRMRGGVLGFRQSNTNKCLKADAEAAVKALGGTLK